MHEHAKAPLSSELKLTVDGKTSAFSPAELAAMAQKTAIVHNEHTKTDEMYSGVPLADLLAKCGFRVEQAWPASRSAATDY